MTDPGGYPEPPGGEAAPTWAPGADGTPIALTPLADESCDFYVAENPAYLERYGEPGREWLHHDYLHVLSWAMTLRTQEQLDRELAWLARVLEARDFPLAWFVRGIEVLGERVRDRQDFGDAGARILTSATFLRSRPSFLTER